MCVPFRRRLIALWSLLYRLDLVKMPAHCYLLVIHLCTQVLQGLLWFTEYLCAFTILERLDKDLLADQIRTRQFFISTIVFCSVRFWWNYKKSQNVLAIYNDLIFLRIFSFIGFLKVCCQTRSSCTFPLDYILSHSIELLQSNYAIFLYADIHY